MDPDGSHVHRLGRVQAAFPSFSPDGSEIVFMKNPASSEDLAFMNADGTNVPEPPCRPIPGPRPRCVPVSASIPIFSPDGTKIADSGGALVTMNLDGSGRQRLTQTSRSPAQIGWQPLP